MVELVMCCAAYITVFDNRACMTAACAAAQCCYELHLLHVMHPMLICSRKDRCWDSITCSAAKKALGVAEVQVD